MQNSFANKSNIKCSMYMSKILPQWDFLAGDFYIFDNDDSLNTWLLMTYGIELYFSANSNGQLFFLLNFLWYYLFTCWFVSYFEFLLAMKSHFKKERKNKREGKKNFSVSYIYIFFQCMCLRVPKHGSTRWPDPFWARLTIPSKKWVVCWFYSINPFDLFSF